MTLLTPLALLIGLTAAVPLVLHLYQQRRRAVIEFSTNRFFTAAIVRSQRRLRLRRLLLLILRVATCVLLALALARPLTTLAGFGGRPGTRDVVILLDDSLSMQAKPDGPASAGRSNGFEQARQLTLEALGELTSGDRAAVITFTGKTIGEVTRSGLQLSEDLLKLTDEVERLRPTFAAGDAHRALDQAAKLFEEATARNRLLLVLSDLQAADWRQADWPQPIHPVSVALVRVGAVRLREDASRYVDAEACLSHNVVADQMILSQGTAVVGQPNLLRVRLLNYRPDTTPAELILKVNGKERLRRPIELASRSPQIERIPLVFNKAGEKRLMLHIATRDSLGPDNTLYATLRVNPQLPVLLIDGQSTAVPTASGSSPPGQPRRSAAYYLRAALRAVNAEGDAIQVDCVRPDALAPATLEGYRVVILSEVRQLSVAQLERLERFVEDGGGLAILLGEHADHTFYNDVMGAPTRPLGGLLPAELDALVEPAQTIEPLHILAADVEHPILQRFQGTLRSALAGIAVYRTHVVRPRDAWVLASLDQQLPLLIERSYGAGSVLLCATPPHPHSTNLPLRRAFVPLCSRIVTHLAAGAVGFSPYGYCVGEDLELLRGAWDDERPFYVVRPDDTRVRAAVRVVGAEPVAYVPAQEVNEPGFFRIEASSAGKSTPKDAGRRFAVNVPRAESSPDVLDLEDSERLAGNWRLILIDADDLTPAKGATAAVAAGPGAGRTLVGAGWLSRGVWDTLLWTVFVLVLAEPLIANQVIRLRRTFGAGPGTDQRARRMVA